MPEQRARTYHRGRVVNTFAEEITAMLEGELSDPRISPCHVTEVVLAPGGKSCRVFIAVTGTAAEEESTLEGLMAARAFIRTEIRYRMNVRHVPEITFAIDRSEKINARMDVLLHRMEKRRSKQAPIQAQTQAPTQTQTQTQTQAHAKIHTKTKSQPAASPAGTAAHSETQP